MNQPFDLSNKLWAQSTVRDKTPQQEYEFAWVTGTEKRDLTGGSSSMGPQSNQEEHGMGEGSSK